jgi:hypothetical protein
LKKRKEERMQREREEKARREQEEYERLRQQEQELEEYETMNQQHERKWASLSKAAKNLAGKYALAELKAMKDNANCDDDIEWVERQEAELETFCIEHLTELETLLYKGTYQIDEFDDPFTDQEEEMDIDKASRKRSLRARDGDDLLAINEN